MSTNEYLTLNLNRTSRKLSFSLEGANHFMEFGFYICKDAQSSDAEFIILAIDDHSVCQYHSGVEESSKYLQDHILAATQICMGNELPYPGMSDIYIKMLSIKYGATPSFTALDCMGALHVIDGILPYIVENAVNEISGDGTS